ncbi:MAG: DEAD/DEAH box helicase [Bryobacteraceae bacterium]|nr:DEAD/DEAH box helicase [Bryobacteraceae bacterium]
MSLALRLSPRFSVTTRTRGHDLFAHGAVRPVRSTPTELEAVVRGGEDYDVDLALSGNALRVACECAAFIEYGPCKHIWATILEADRRGALDRARHISPLTLVDGFHLPPAGRPPLPPPAAPIWREQLQAIARHSRDHAFARTRATAWPAGFEIGYAIDLPGSRSAGALVLQLLSRNRKKNGEWTVFKDLRLSAPQIPALPDPQDVEILQTLVGAPEPYHFGYHHDIHRFALSRSLALKVLPVIAAAQRLWSAPEYNYHHFRPISWDAGDPWRFVARIQRNERDLWELTGEFRRGESGRLPLDAPEFIFYSSGMLLHGQTLARLHDTDALPWIRQLLSDGAITFTDRDRDAALADLLDSPILPQLDLAPEIQFEQQTGAPRFGVRLEQLRDTFGETAFAATLLADYGAGFQPLRREESRGFWLPAQRLYILRDQPAEEAAWQTLAQNGVRLSPDGASPGRLAPKAMPKLARHLIAAGWHVEAEGKAFRRPGTARLDVSSGIDWFELRGQIDYDGQTASLPDLLAAIRRGDAMVRLGDGSYGLLPEEWLAKFAPLAGLGEATGDHLRFRPSQTALLDALLAAQSEVRVDEVFEHARERLRTFGGVKPAVQPEGFQGQLRGYQLEGLGWIEFLREFGFGGILADDMGVGKTAQVLAALEQRRTGGHGPSLVVAPRSLLFNWRQEAERFTPQLKVLDHAGQQRNLDRIDQHHLVLTTYGTLLRDVATLSQRRFDYVILDEAQAIKNAGTASAKAVRLLKGNHRLALSGTPIENHLGELWSLFEFLNPGMLGEAKVLKLAGGLARNPSEETRRLLAAALRPFILRRTKQQVARELPEKTEQTIFCELEGDQRRQYDELRDHYRNRLLRPAASTAGKAAWNKMKFQVLEALLRLRQAACHPGLLDAKLADQPGAKFTTLIDQLEELREEGHKALVFSQFTSLLGLLKTRLDEAGFTYEYLDGATRNRQVPVERFQTNPDTQLFLISLRAGGLGLNLTAAGYVFLLDPWWNPAVEAQAIDRAHRIGQTQNVFAYRLIAKNTVEEKVLELQKSKRALADAILSEDNAVLRDLTREDLEMLLS